MGDISQFLEFSGGMLYLDVMSNEYVRVDDRPREAVAKYLDTERARVLGALHFPVPEQSRLESLAEKANEGQLTADEASEFDRSVELSDIIATLRLRADRQ